MFLRKWERFCPPFVHGCCSTASTGFVRPAALRRICCALLCTKRTSISLFSNLASYLISRGMSLQCSCTRIPHLAVRCSCGGPDSWLYQPLVESCQNPQVCASRAAVGLDLSITMHVSARSAQTKRSLGKPLGTKRHSMLHV